MALKDIQIPKADVAVGAGGSFAVRGLSTADIEHCVREFGGELAGIFDKFVNGETKPGEMLTEGGLQKTLLGICRQSPALVIGILGLAADADEEDMAVLKKLPVTVQVKALMNVATLTLAIEGDLKKALETAITALGGLNGLLTQAQLNSLNA